MPEVTENDRASSLREARHPHGLGGERDSLNRKEVKGNRRFVGGKGSRL